MLQNLIMLSKRGISKNNPRISRLEQTQQYMSVFCTVQNVNKKTNISSTLAVSELVLVPNLHYFYSIEQEMQKKKILSLRHIEY